MTEIWKNIPGWSAYSASTLGRIKRNYPGKYKWGRNLLVPSYGTLHCNDYMRVTLLRDEVLGKRTSSRFLVQELILLTFIGKRPENYEALHRDDIKTNNRLSNLYWGTSSDNKLDILKNGKKFGTASLSKEKRKLIATKRIMTMRKNDVRFGTGIQYKMKKGDVFLYERPKCNVP